MEKMGRLLLLLDHTLDSKKKRHLTGGILISMSLLFGGLAITVMTLNLSNEEEISNNNDYALINVE